jgi:hypothetical protein
VAAATAVSLPPWLVPLRGGPARTQVQELVAVNSSRKKSAPSAGLGAGPGLELGAGDGDGDADPHCGWAKPSAQVQVRDVAE